MPDQTNVAAFPTPSPKPTGDMLVVMRPNMKTTTAAKKLRGLADIQVAVSKDYAKKPQAMQHALDEADCLYMDHLNVAVLKQKSGTDTSALMTTLSGDTDVVSVRPEFYMYTTSALQQRYQEWVREGLRILAEGAPGSFGNTRAAGAGLAQPAMTDSNSTWGVNATGAAISNFTGDGIKVAVLDTGFDLTHPDFAGRCVTAESFVPDEEAQDGHGHGTHCIGTACGPPAGDGHPRYGVATEASIFAGKVLSNGGSGRESWILSGIEWAITNGCEIISMSLGRSTQVGEAPDPLYEQAGQAALENGSLIIAAAGNDSSRRFNHIAPVGAPANSPSIMAVGAVDIDMNIADFSCGGINEDGGEVNVCGPGVDVLSSFPVPENYRRLQGTSMATPHVAGIAAMLAQSDDDLRGNALWDALRRTALDVGLPIRDGGAGMVQAPGNIHCTPMV